ncbi:MAG: pyridoxamine 5'-phosphate oxidase [Candidatus Methylomirabilia bacterium]
MSDETRLPEGGPRPPLPEPLPADPLPVLTDWLAEDSAAIPNATAMTLATVEPDGRPSARMVICRGFDSSAGWFVFYTDRESPKGRALAAYPWAALVVHWDTFERQIRIEGPVTPASDAETDAYWESRPADARIAAVASRQSEPIESRQEMLARVAAVAARSATGIARPERWGGYRVWAERVELWVGQPARVHDRAVSTRVLERTSEGYRGGPWRATRLQP